MPSRHAPLHRVQLLTLLSIAGCDIVESVRIDQLAFNPKLRADLAPLDEPGQAIRSEDPMTPVTKAYLDDGTFGGITSELSLSRTGEYRSIPLRNTECLWIAPNDDVKLHWETIAAIAPLDEELELEPGTEVIGACTHSHPFWREFVRDVDGNEYPFGPDECRIDDAVRLRSRQMPDYGPFFNANDTCLSPLGAPTDVPASAGWCGPDSAGNWPNCNPEGCEFAIDADTRFELSASIDGAVTPLRGWGPVVKRVSGTRQLIRPMKLDPNTTNPQQTVFSYVVEALGDGRWAENFSANLRVTRYRIFGLSPQGHRVYLDPWIMELGATGQCTASLRSDYSISCPGAEPSIVPMTPTYLHDTPDRRLQWSAFFTDDPRKGGFAPAGQCCEGTEAQCCDDGWCPPMCGEEGQHGALQENLFIEFTVVDLQHQAPDLFTSPRALDFGPVEWGSSWHQQVSVENTGGMPVMIKTLDLAESQPGAFSANLASGASLPQTIAPGDTLRLDVIARSDPTAGAEPTAILTVEGEASNGTILQSETALRYLSYMGPQAIPVYADFEDIGQIHLCTDGYRQALLVVNTGDRALERSAYRLEGPGASAFRLEPYRGVTLDPDILPPGDSDVVYVYFEDDGSGASQWEASVLFESNARNLVGGHFEVELVGFAEESALHPGCRVTRN